MPKTQPSEVRMCQKRKPMDCVLSSFGPAFRLRGGGGGGGRRAAGAGERGVLDQPDVEDHDRQAAEQKAANRDRAGPAESFMARIPDTEELNGGFRPIRRKIARHRRCERGETPGVRPTV